MTQQSEKPTKRGDAQNYQKNLSRYVLGGFVSDSPASLGIDINYPKDIPQGVRLTGFQVDSAARAAGLEEFDLILEVEGSPVGLIRGRYYEPWRHYGRSTEGKVELLVSYELKDRTLAYYYPVVDTRPIKTIAAYVYVLPDSFFTTAKPVERNQPENKIANVSRYALNYGDFQSYARYELGVDLDYSDGYARIVNIEPDTPAASPEAGLQVGDLILEVGGAPVGIFGDRWYEVWRQYQYSKDGNVEFLIEIPDPILENTKYYYPTIKLNPLSAQA